MSIPIENVYYLLCYALDNVEHKDLVGTEELDHCEHALDLLSLVLAEGAFHLLRRGLDRSYRETAGDLAGVRGRIAMGETVKRALRARGRIHCVYEELSHDVHHNRLIRSTLRVLLQLPKLDRPVRQKVRVAYQKMEGVSVVRVDRQAFRRVQLDRNRGLYRFLIQVCALVHDSILVDESSGSATFVDIRREPRSMWQLFERFVTEFYKREQGHFAVNRGGRRIRWSELGAARPEDLAKIPRMSADVLLDAPDRRIIVDTKFYEHALPERWGAPKLHSANVYQLLAYLRNRQANHPDGPKHEGVLLYPVVDAPISVDVRLEGFRVRARGIDLAQDWRGIHRDMLALIESEVPHQEAAP